MNWHSRVRAHFVTRLSSSSSWGKLCPTSGWWTSGHPQLPTPWQAQPATEPHSFSQPLCSTFGQSFQPAKHMVTFQVLFSKFFLLQLILFWLGVSRLRTNQPNDRVEEMKESLLVCTLNSWFTRRHQYSYIGNCFKNSSLHSEDMTTYAPLLIHDLSLWHAV